jgi:ABC-type glycerol-3-phosphate transport system substrate-binding protein
MSSHNIFNNRRRIYLIILVVLTLSMILGACAAPTTPAPTEVPPQTAPTQVPQQLPTSTVASAPITLEFWDYTSPGPQETWYADFIQSYEKSHPGITVHRVGTVEKDYDQKLRTAIAAGQVPDIFFVISGDNVSEFATAGVLTPLDKLVDKSIWIPSLLEGLSYNGSVYAIPESPTPAPIWYNIALFKEHSVNPPKTWDDLLNACDTFNKAGITPISIGMLERWEIELYYQNILNQLAGPDFEYKAAHGQEASFSDPRAIQAAQYIVDLIDRGCFPKDFASMDQNAMATIFFSGQAAMEMMGPWLVGMSYDGAPKGFQMGAMQFPTMPNAIPGTETNIVGAIDGYGISASSKNQQAAADFLDAYGKANQDYATVVGYLPTIPGGTVTDPALSQAADLFGQANYMITFSDRLVPAVIVDDYMNSYVALTLKQVTPTQFGEQMATAVSEKVK